MPPFFMFSKNTKFFKPFTGISYKLLAEAENMWYNKYVMKEITDNNDLILENAEDFVLEHIFECGQCFRWDRIADDTYCGVAGGHALKIRQEGKDIRLFDTAPELFTSFWRDYFDLNTDYGDIKRELSQDSVLAEAIPDGYGIRILRQELWETIVSFIISASNNIPRIRSIIAALCKLFGDKLQYMGEDFYSFPSAQRLVALEPEELAPIRAGFRSKYIIAAARAVSSGDISLDRIKSLDTADAKTELLRFSGVGSKVADCTLLFALHKTDAFPVDVWVKRIMEYCYFHEDTPKAHIEAFGREKFGSYAGYAQQYLFYWARKNHIGV